MVKTVCAFASRRNFWVLIVAAQVWLAAGLGVLRAQEFNAGMYLDPYPEGKSIQGDVMPPEPPRMRPQAGGQPIVPVVRIGYVVPSNRTPNPKAVANLRSVIQRTQSFYRTQMDELGYGPKAFQYEVEVDGTTPAVHTVTATVTDDYLRGDIWSRTCTAASNAGLSLWTPGEVWLLVPEAHIQNSDASISGGTSLGAGTAGTGGGVAMMGSDSLVMFDPDYATDDRSYQGMIIPELGPLPLVTNVSFVWFEGATLSSVSSSKCGAVIHEMGHAFGLPHDFRHDSNFNGDLMGNGLRGLRGVFSPMRYSTEYCRLSTSSGAALNTSRYFNLSAAGGAASTTLSVTTQGNVTPVNGQVRIAFGASDADGLAIAWLQQDGNMIAEMPLSGTAASATFSTPYFVSGTANHYSVTVYDVYGNRAAADATITPALGTSQAPKPYIKITPGVILPGEAVTFDASLSSDPNDSSSSLKVEWDLNGDGTYETAPSTTQTLTRVVNQPGTQFVRVRVTDSSNASTVSSAVTLYTHDPSVTVTRTGTDNSSQIAWLSKCGFDYQIQTSPDSSIWSSLDLPMLLGDGALLSYLDSPQGAPGDAGANDLRVAIRKSSPTPWATTGPADRIAYNAARLSGLINSNGASTSAYFEYGLTSAYGAASLVSFDTAPDRITKLATADLSGLQARRTYHCRLVAANASGTSYGADQVFTTADPPPTVATGLASGTTAHGVYLSGTVNANGSATSVFFQYGPTIAYGSTTPLVNFGSQSFNQEYKTLLANLAAATTYHYRLVAINASGTTRGSDRMFATSSGAPLLSTGTAIEGTPTLSGLVTPGGQGATVYFEYGPTATYGNSSPSQALAPGAAEVLVSATLGALSPAVAYHYRIVASSGGATAYGADQLFILPRAIPFLPVVATGDLAPSAWTSPAEARFLSFASPILNPGTPANTGHCAFRALLSGGGFTAKNSSGIWLASGSNLTLVALVALSGQPAPGGGFFGPLQDPVLNGNDEVAFLGSATGATSANALGIWATTSGSMHLVARTGTPLTAQGGVKPSGFPQIALAEDGGVLFLANLVNGLGGVTSKNNQGIWVERNSQLTALVRKGDLLAGGTVSALNILGCPRESAGTGGQTRSFNSNSELAFKVTFTSKVQSIFVLDPGTGLMEVARSAAPAPSVFGAPARFGVLGSPILNENGNTAFQAFVSGTAKASPARSAILAESGSSRLFGIVAVTGTQAPDANGDLGNLGPYSVLGDPVFNSQDQVAFIAKLKTGGVITGANSQGIWANTSGQLKLVARAGQQAAQCPDGVTFSSFSQLVMPGDGGLLFLACLSGKTAGVTGANNQGIWAMDSQGALHLIARKGDALLVGGTAKTIASLSVFSTSAGTTGQTRSFDRFGNMVFKATFADKSQALRKTILP